MDEQSGESEEEEVTGERICESEMQCFLQLYTAAASFILINFPFAASALMCFICRVSSLCFG